MKKDKGCKGYWIYLIYIIDFRLIIIDIDNIIIDIILLYLKMNNKHFFKLKYVLI